jgi:hypothetical protein
VQLFIPYAMVKISYSLMFSALSNSSFMNDMKTHTLKERPKTPLLCLNIFNNKQIIFKGENNSFQQRNDNGFETVGKTYRSRNEKRNRKLRVG